MSMTLFSKNHLNISKWEFNNMCVEHKYGLEKNRAFSCKQFHEYNFNISVTFLCFSIANFRKRKIYFFNHFLEKHRWCELTRQTNPGRVKEDPLMHRNFSLNIHSQYICSTVHMFYSCLKSTDTDNQLQS